MGSPSGTRRDPTSSQAPSRPYSTARSPYFAIGALRGWADGELTNVRDGKVTAEEAQAYVSRALRALQIRDQQPVWVSEGSPDEWVLAEGVTEVGPPL